MFTVRMIGIPGDVKKPRLEIEMPLNWTCVESRPFQPADVGDNCVTYVAVFSPAEVAKKNHQYRVIFDLESKEELLEKDPRHDLGHMDSLRVFGAQKVDQLLEAIKDDGLSKSWVLVEAYTYD
jgi:hypothetical protein